MGQAGSVGSVGGVGGGEVGRWGGRGVKEASKRLLFFLIPPSPHLPISPSPIPSSPSSPTPHSPPTQITSKIKADYYIRVLILEKKYILLLKYAEYAKKPDYLSLIICLKLFLRKNLKRSINQNFYFYS
nr:hypothetical protein [Nostoc sp. CreGUA01]